MADDRQRLESAVRDAKQRRDRARQANAEATDAGLPPPSSDEDITLLMDAVDDAEMHARLAGGDGAG